MGGITNALLNCHVRGMHSIVLNDDAIGRQRMFVATPGHELHKNFMLNFGTISKDQSLAFHAHHCDITLIPIFGNIVNMTPYFGSLRSMKQEPWLCGQFKYDSAINGKSGGLKATGKGRALRDIWERKVTSPLMLKADEYHTIAVPEGESAAWLVFEGYEDNDYKPECYTFNPVFDPAQYYQPMQSQQIASMLDQVLRLNQIKNILPTKR